MKKTLAVMCLAAMVTVFLVPASEAEVIFCLACLTVEDPDQPCGGFGCPGVPSITTCGVWIANGCPVLFAPSDISAHELFLRVLEVQAAVEQPVETAAAETAV